MPTEGILDDLWAAGRTLYAWRVIEPGWINQLYVGEVARRRPISRR
jgi:hypothetical protein